MLNTGSSGYDEIIENVLVALIVVFGTCSYNVIGFSVRTPTVKKNATDSTHILQSHAPIISSAFLLPVDDLIRYELFFFILLSRKSFNHCLPLPVALRTRYWFCWSPIQENNASWTFIWTKLPRSRIPHAPHTHIESDFLNSVCPWHGIDESQTKTTNVFWTCRTSTSVRKWKSSLQINWRSRQHTLSSRCHMSDDREPEKPNEFNSLKEWRVKHCDWCFFTTLALMSFLQQHQLPFVQKLFIHFKFYWHIGVAAGPMRWLGLENYCSDFVWARKEISIMEIWKDVCLQCFTCSWHACVRKSLSNTEHFKYGTE